MVLPVRGFSAFPKRQRARDAIDRNNIEGSSLDGRNPRRRQRSADRRRRDRPRVKDQRAITDKARGRDTALQRVLQQAYASQRPSPSKQGPSRAVRVVNTEPGRAVGPCASNGAARRAQQPWAGRIDWSCDKRESDFMLESNIVTRIRESVAAALAHRDRELTHRRLAASTNSFQKICRPAQQQRELCGTFSGNPIKANLDFLISDLNQNNS